MSKVNISEEKRKKLFERDNFTCQKCGFQDKTTEEIEPHHIVLRVSDGESDIQNLITLCSICHYYSPDSREEFDKYLKEKIDGNILNTFRKSERSVSKRTKKGMLKKFNAGVHLTKAPKGYNLVNKELIINDQEAEQVRKIFEEFLNSGISLTQLAKKHNMTTAGIKKLLKNTTYLGRVKFAGQESNGQHKPLIEEELFKNVQEKIG